VSVTVLPVGWQPIATAPRVEGEWILVDTPWDAPGMTIATWAHGTHFDDGIGRWRLNEDWEWVHPEPRWWRPLPPMPPAEGK
jgi:hypothetical protein